MTEPRLGDDGFEALTAKISRERGFGCASYKEKCLRRRIAVRMRARGVHTYEDYARILDRDAAEYDRLLDALTINVTKLFRNLGRVRGDRSRDRSRAVRARRGTDARLERRLLVGRGAVLARDALPPVRSRAAACASIASRSSARTSTARCLAAAERATFSKATSPIRRTSCGRATSQCRRRIAFRARCARSCVSSGATCCVSRRPEAQHLDRLPERHHLLRPRRHRSGCSRRFTRRCAGRLSRARQGRDAARPRAHEVRARRRARADFRRL